MKLSLTLGLAFAEIKDFYDVGFHGCPIEPPEIANGKALSTFQGRLAVIWLSGSILKNLFRR